MDPTAGNFTVETTSSGSPAALLIPLVIGILYIVAGWKIFTKAGKPGIASIVPIWNALVTLDIAGKPGWWFILCLIPGVNLVIGIIVAIALAANFGKGTGFAVGLILLSPIFVLILAFGSAQYVGAAPAASEPAAAPAA